MIIFVLITAWLTAFLLVYIPLVIRAEREMNLWLHCDKWKEAIGAVCIFLAASLFLYLPFCVWISK